MSCIDNSCRMILKKLETERNIEVNGCAIGYIASVLRPLFSQTYCTHCKHNLQGRKPSKHG